MAIKSNHPQIMVYWIELILDIICCALAGKGYIEIGYQYLIAISSASAIGNIVFLLIYGFKTTRPPPGRSLTKFFEILYQLLLTILYCIAIGVTFNRAQYLYNFIGPVTIFTSANFGAHIFGSMIALTELLYNNIEINEDSDMYKTKIPSSSSQTPNTMPQFP